MKLIKKVNYLYFRNINNLTSFFEEKNQKLLSQITGVYFGEEFCEHLIPSIEDVKKAYKFTRAMDKTFSFITTIASPDLINSYKNIFNFLNKQNKAEIIINDWGILHLLTQRFKNIKPVLGRLLTKNKRYIYKKFSPDTENLLPENIPIIKKNQLKILRETNFSVKEYQKFLKNYGIEKIDIDIPPQGINVDSVSGFSFGFYYPWGYLTGGRTCPYNKKSPFHVPSVSCSNNQYCGRTKILTSETWNTQLLEIGNVVLYRVKKHKINPRFDRIILEMDIGVKLPEILQLLTRS